MAENTKDRILQTAALLFTEKGYAAVSMRDVANELGISVGNLTYHYPKKDDLVQEVAALHQESYRKTPPFRTLEAAHLFFIRIARQNKDGSRCCCRNAPLAKVSASAYKIQRSMMNTDIKTLRSSFNAMQMAGIVADEEIDAQYRRLCTTLVYLLLCGQENENELIACAWNLIYPVLTRKGRRIWQAEISPKLRRTKQGQT